VFGEVGREAGGGRLIADDEEVLRVAELRVLAPIVTAGDDGLTVDDGILVVHHLLGGVCLRLDGRLTEREGGAVSGDFLGRVED
jgi:hypothetical protein